MQFWAFCDGGTGVSVMPLIFFPQLISYWWMLRASTINSTVCDVHGCWESDWLCFVMEITMPSWEGSLNHNAHLCLTHHLLFWSCFFKCYPKMESGAAFYGLLCFFCNAFQAKNGWGRCYYWRRSWRLYGATKKVVGLMQRIMAEFDNEILILHNIKNSKDKL